jgi:hypothetical protein
MVPLVHCFLWATLQYAILLVPLVLVTQPQDRPNGEHRFQQLFYSCLSNCCCHHVMVIGHSTVANACLIPPMCLPRHNLAMNVSSHSRILVPQFRLQWTCQCTQSFSSCQLSLYA